MKTARRRYAPAVTLIVDDRRWRKRAGALASVRRAAKLALAPPAPRGAHLAILLTDDATLEALNAKFRRKKRPTNVLSFPSPGGRYLGDVALAYGVVAREAREQKKRFAAHAAHLAAHGVLHLIGYDHGRSAQAARMERLEAEILSKMGISDPYAAAGKAA